jgi:hypothetical protein
MRDYAGARVIAFYLPQFHPTPENDEWWGKGFTEWTNVAKARPLYPGHDQPRVPRDLGFYDLRVPETRQAQADLAVEHGVEAFCYWHYWFHGRRILERPFEEVLRSGRPELPFCLAWATQSWTGVWHGAENRILLEQTYSDKDHVDHFDYLLPAFRDERYLRVAGRPLFGVLCPRDLPDAKRTTDRWRELARKAGLPGLYLVALGNGEHAYDVAALGFDAFSNSNQTRIHWYVTSPGFRRELSRSERARRAESLRYDLEEGARVAKYLARARVSAALGFPRNVYSYRDAMRYFLAEEDVGVPNHPTLVPNWDHSPRSGAKSIILHGSTPELFRAHVRKALDLVRAVPAERRIVFIKSWNEWAEGNYMEPDLRHGDAYLRTLRDELRRDPEANGKNRARYAAA